MLLASRYTAAALYSHFYSFFVVYTGIQHSRIVPVACRGILTALQRSGLVNHVYSCQLYFFIPRIGSGNPASSSPKPGDQGAAMLFSYKNQWPFASCFGCSSNIPFPLRYVDAARALFPAMPACHALPPSPTNHASRHAPLFFPPVLSGTTPAVPSSRAPPTRR